MWRRGEARRGFFSRAESFHQLLRSLLSQAAARYGAEKQANHFVKEPIAFHVHAQFGTAPAKCDPRYIPQGTAWWLAAVRCEGGEVVSSLQSRRCGAHCRKIQRGDNVPAPVNLKRR